MDIAHPISSTVSSGSFSFLTTEDIRRISVKQITNPVLLDNLNQPNIGGLYDPALGPTAQRDMSVLVRLPSHPLFNFPQMYNMSIGILYMPWTLWTYRTTFSCIPPTIHNHRLQAVARDVSLLPPLQGNTDRSKHGFIA
jgi:hypothetical protein